MTAIGRQTSLFPFGDDTRLLAGPRPGGDDGRRELPFGPLHSLSTRGDEFCKSGAMELTDETCALASCDRDVVVVVTGVGWTVDDVRRVEDAVGETHRKGERQEFEREMPRAGPPAGITVAGGVCRAGASRESKAVGAFVALS